MGAITEIELLVFLGCTDVVTLVVAVGFASAMTFNFKIYN
jgi:hypothetical protein